MTGGAISDMDPLQRRARMISLAAVVLVGVISYAIVTLAGDRQVTDRVEALRRAMSTATIDPSLGATPAGVDPLSAALSPEDYVALQRLDTDGDLWCFRVDVEALLDSEALFFLIDDAGRFTETSTCTDR